MKLRDLLHELDATPNDDTDERLDFDVKFQSERNDSETYDASPGIRNDYSDQQVVISLE